MDYSQIRQAMNDLSYGKENLLDRDWFIGRSFDSAQIANYFQHDGRARSGTCSELALTFLRELKGLVQPNRAAIVRGTEPLYFFHGNVTHYFNLVFANDLVDADLDEILESNPIVADASLGFLGRYHDSHYAVTDFPKNPPSVTSLTLKPDLFVPLMIDEDGTMLYFGRNDEQGVAYEVGFQSMHGDVRYVGLADESLDQVSNPKIKRFIEKLRKHFLIRPVSRH